MGKVGWYSLAVAALCTVTLLCVPWTVHVNVHTATAFAEEDGMLSLLPEETSVNLGNGSTATNNGPTSDPLAGGAIAATKRLPSTSSNPAPPQTKSVDLLNARQQELSLRTAGKVAEMPSPTAANSTPSVKPTVKPNAVPSASKPTTTPKPTPAPKVEIKPSVSTKADPSEIEQSSTGFIEQIDLPEETRPAENAPEEPGRSLRSLFSEDELNDPGTDGALVASARNPGLQNDIPPIEPNKANKYVGVISTGHGSEETEITPEESTGIPTLGQILRGEASESEVGSSLKGYNPLRSGAMVLLVLALMFVGAWLARKWRNPLVSLRQNTLAVIETISIGPGRQLIIVEMNNDALVLGVTPQSINMLDKVPLEELNGSYQHTVNSIVKREEHALPSEWHDRPAFSTGANVPPAPALASAGTYGPSGRLTVSQMLKANEAAQSKAGIKPGIVPSHFLNEQDTKTELIDRIRQQLNQLGR